jgi:hypothetical protein
MKGILQYCDTVDGTFKNVGVVRLKKNKVYEVKPITEDSREGVPVTTSYQVTIHTIALELNTDFLTAHQWYFRVGFFDDLTMIALGLRDYQVGYDGKMNLNTVEYYPVTVSFIVDFANFQDFGNQESLPPGEGGIIIEDNDIYIESP